MFFLKKINRNVFSAILIFASLFVASLALSCDNAADDSTRIFIIAAKKKELARQEAEREAREAAERAAQAAAEEQARLAQEQAALQSRMVIFRGSANVQRVLGAAPQEISALAAPFDDALNGLVSMSALPNANDTAAYELFAQATAPGKDTVEGRFGAAGTPAARQFELALEIGNTWTIVCGLRGKDDKKIALSDTYVFAATVDEPVFSRNFTPVPTAKESGSLELSFEIPSGVSSVKASCSDPGWKAACGGSESKTLSVSGSSAILEFDSIKSGSYSVVFTFFDAAGIPLYTTVQSVSVFDNMRTNWWTSSGGDDDLTVSGGRFALTNDIIQKFSSTTIYVGDTHFGDAPSDVTGDGSPAMPLASLNRAAAQIASTGDSDKDFRIFIAGTVEGTAALPGSLDGKAKSVTILGVNGLDENRVPKDAIDAKQGGTALSVATSVPVTVQNLKITGGSAECGGGISASGSGVKVTLKAGVLVAGNSAQNGGGAYIADGAKICMEGGSLEANTATTAGGAAFVAADGDCLSVKGSASVPYGGLGSDGKPVNDIYLAQKTDNTYSAVQIAGSFAPDVSGGKLAITAQGWARKSVVVKAADGSGVLDITRCKDYFVFTNGDVEMGFGGADKKVAKLTAPYFVAPGGHDTPETTGTKTDPYKSVSYAVNQINGGDAEFINIKGVLQAADSLDLQTIPSSLTADNCSSLTLQGWGDDSSPALDSNGIPVNAIDANKKGSALTVETTVPVTIKNLKITGGSAPYGGGIYMDSGSKVTLESGSLVGDEPGAPAQAATIGSCANKAENFGGGIYVYGGSLVLKSGSKISRNYCGHGADPDDEPNIDAEGGGIWCIDGSVTMEAGSKICYNGTDGRGGGVCIGDDDASARLTMNGGEISHNETTGWGGGVLLRSENDASANLVFDMNGGTIEQNKAIGTYRSWGVGAGGVWMDAGKFVMKEGAAIRENWAYYVAGGLNIEKEWCEADLYGGTFEDNSSNEQGGAIRNWGILKIGGGFSAPCGENGENHNDIFLQSDTKATLFGTWNSSAAETVARITLPDDKWQRGAQVLDEAASGLAAGFANRFKTTDPDFAVKVKSAATSQGVLFAPKIYLASVDPDDTTRAECAQGETDATKARGSRKSPFATLADALSYVSAEENEIIVDGKITGAQTISSVPSGVTIDLHGLVKTGETASAASFDGGGSARPLTVNAGKVDISDLLITRGYATDGGGLYVASGAEVTLKAGGVIAENEAYKKGGGVYVDGNFTLDGGVIGDDDSEKGHATISQNSNHTTYWDSAGGGIYYSATGKVAIKSGIIAYNYSYKGGGIDCDLGSYQPTSQLTIEGGEICYNCSAEKDGYYNWGACGGGIFVNGSKFSFTGGEIHHNFGGDGGGGLFLQNTDDAVMSGGSIHDNDYYNVAPGLTKNCKWGSDLLVFDAATLSMTGGSISSLSEKEYGVKIKATSSALKMSGDAVISKNTPVLVGDIVYHEDTETYTYEAATQITIAGALTKPDPDDDSVKNAYIVPIQWTRGLQVLKTPDTITDETAKKALIANNYSRFATIDDDFDVKANGVAGIINAPFCVGGLYSTIISPDAEGKTWGEPSDTLTARGTRAHPYAKMSQVEAAVNALGDRNVPCEVIINGTVQGADKACASFGSSDTVTISGANGYDGENCFDALDADSLGAGNTSKSIALKFIGAAAASKMSATIQNLKITGANNLGGGDYYPHGGGIYAHWANISLGKGVLITGNKAYNGGGVYLDGSNLFVYADARIGQDASGTATGESDCSNYAKNEGGGICCDNSNAYLGYKEDLNVAEGDDAWTGGIYRNCSSYNGGGIRIGNGSKIQIAAGNISRNLATKEGGGIYIHSAGGNSAVISGGKIEENQSQATGTYEGGGGICNLGSLVVKDDAEILGNIANKGGGVYDGNASGSLSLSGGKFQNNTADSGGAICHIAGTLTMGGTAWIPYGVTTSGGGTTTTATGAGKNDVFINNEKYITIESALSLPAGVTSGANATITPNGWKRGTVIAQGKDGDALPTGTKDRLALAGEAGDGWEIYGSSDGKLAKIMAPICVAAASYPASPGSNSNIGTYSKPYATVTNALSDLNDPEVDYEIYIKGNIVEHVTISQNTTDHAKSLFLAGYDYDLSTTATGILDGGCDADTPLDSSNIGRTLSITGNVPVTIKGIAIKGGKEKDGAGGGIFAGSGANLTLDNYTSVTDNYCVWSGGGVLAEADAIIKVNGCVTIKDNKMIDDDDSTGTIIGDDNLFLPLGKLIYVIGSLNDGYGNSSEIWVSTAEKPSISGSTVNTVTITEGYKANNPGVSPGVYFKGDKYGVALVGNEAALGVHGGGISVEDIYKDLAFSIDKTWVTKASLSGAGARFIVSGTIDGQPVNFTTPTSDYYASISLKLLYHGEEIPQTSSYYSFTAPYLYLYSGLPAGDYVIAATVVHGGKTYSASFDIKVIGDSVPDGYVMTGGETVTGAVGTTAPSSVFIAGRSVDIPVLIACDHEVTQGEYEKYCYYDTNKPTDDFGKGENYPAYYVSWYDALVYCNLRSLAEGLTPVYSIDGKTDPKQWPAMVAGTGDDIGKYRGLDYAITSWDSVAFDQSANGWRLPTEAEWEYLARAANTKDCYCSGTSQTSDINIGPYAWFSYNSKVNNTRVSHEVKGKQPNALGGAGHGLYDMSGNVAEWCWDWSGDISASSSETGPDTGTDKVIRGGSYQKAAVFCAVNYRQSLQTPQTRDATTGFRVVRTAR